MSNNTLAYLATPYSKYRGGMWAAYWDAAALAARLLRSGINCYSPIAHTHPIAMHGHIDPLDHSIWLPFDELMMARCDTLIVAHMEGWQESKGIAHEIEFFKRAGKPIFDLPDVTTCTLVRRLFESDYAMPRADHQCERVAPPDASLMANIHDF